MSSKLHDAPACNASSSPPATTRSASIRASRRLITASCRGPTAAMASARHSVRRSPASIPTSTELACCARVSGISERSRSTSAGCRSGSARATIPNSCASGSSTPIFATKSSMASRTTGVPGTTIRMRHGWATGRRMIPSPMPRRCSPPKRASRPIPSPSITRAARSAPPNTWRKRRSREAWARAPQAQPPAAALVRPCLRRRRSAARRVSGSRPSPRSARPPASSSERCPPPQPPFCGRAHSPASSAHGEDASAGPPYRASSDIRRCRARRPFPAAMPKSCARCCSAGCGISSLTWPYFLAGGEGWTEGLAREGGDPGLGTPQYQGVNVMGAFIGIDRLQIHHVADHLVLVGDAVAAVHVAGGAGDVERLAAIVALQDRDHLGRVAPFVFEPSEAQASVQAESYFGLHVDELFLDQLVGGERAPELAAVERIAARRMPAELASAERAPGNPIPCTVETGERAAQPADARQQVLFGDEYVLHHDLAGGGRAQAELALDLRGAEPLHASFKNKAADNIVLGFGPHDKDIGDR